MIIKTLSDFKDNIEFFLDLAEEDQIVIKKGEKYINLIVSETPENYFVDENWVKDFIAIPSAFRCNPFDISPSGDLFFADRRNIEKIEKSIAESKVRKIITLDDINDIDQLK